jgi:SAM-dependent methyltransferase
MQEHIWEHEYKNPKLVTLSTVPQQSVKDFLRWLRKEQKIPLEHIRALDLGCGNGKNMNYICELDSTNSAVGVDISKTALAHARIYAEKNALQKQVTYIHQSIGDILPFENNSFTIALDITSSNSLTESERAIYLEETYRVLSSGNQTTGSGGYFFVRALCKDGDTNAQQLLKTSPGKEKDTYIMPGLGLTERVFSREDFLATYEPYFTIHFMKKETHYTSFAGKLYKRNFWVAYLQKTPGSRKLDKIA